MTDNNHSNGDDAEVNDHLVLKMAELFIVVRSSQERGLWAKVKETPNGETTPHCGGHCRWPDDRCHPHPHLHFHCPYSSQPCSTCSQSAPPWTVWAEEISPQLQLSAGKWRFLYILKVNHFPKSPCKERAWLYGLRPEMNWKTALPRELSALDEDEL